MVVAELDVDFLGAIVRVRREFRWTVVAQNLYIGAPKDTDGVHEQLASPSG